MLYKYLHVRVYVCTCILFKNIPNINQNLYQVAGGRLQNHWPCDLYSDILSNSLF